LSASEFVFTHSKERILPADGILLTKRESFIGKAHFKTETDGMNVVEREITFVVEPDIRKPGGETGYLLSGFIKSRDFHPFGWIWVFILGIDV